VAVEIRRRAHADGIRPAPLTERRAAPDGVSARAGHRDVRIGSRAFAGQAFGPPGEMPAPSAATVRSQVYLTIGDRPAAVFHFGDRLRPEAAEALATLRHDGRDLALVSGDDAAITADVARRLGIRHHRGGASPDAKAAHVAAFQHQGQGVAMVGDGINDAPALVQARVGIAVNTGASLAQEAADVTLLGGRLTSLPRFFRLSHRVNRKIGQNLAGAFVYNLLSIPLAMAGWLTPLLAVSAMLLSSLSVIGNTLSLMRDADAPDPPTIPPPSGGLDPSEAVGSSQNGR
jgi:cation transport ATPase